MFIETLYNLFTVLGPSNSNWFEDASRRKLQQTSVPRSFDSVIDSPVLTPRISQICTQELRGKFLLTVYTNSEEDRLIFFLFSQKIGFDISYQLSPRYDTPCRFSPYETVCMICEILFLGKIRKIFQNVIC